MSEVVLKDHSIHEPSTAHQHPLETIPQGSQSDGVAFGHEHHDVDVSPLYKLVIGLLVLVAVSLIFSWFVTIRLLDWFSKSDEVPSATYTERAPRDRAWPNHAIQAELQPPTEAPDLQPDPEKPMLVLRDKDNAQLHNYNWVKDEKGRQTGVSIPIEEAMKLTLERGLPTEQRVQVRIEPPTGHVAEMGSIPPSETRMEQEVLKAGKKGGKPGSTDTAH